MHRENPASQSLAFRQKIVIFAGYLELNNYRYMDRKVLLMILDGWGEGRHDHSNAIYTAGAPFIDSLRAIYRHAARLSVLLTDRWETPRSAT